MKRTNAEIRAEGEGHVMAELRRRGVAYRPIKERGRVDLEIPDAGMTVQVRVTSKGDREGWLLSDVLERATSPRLIVALVNIESPVPETFLLPGRVVSDVLRISHAAWLATPGRGGRPHRDTSMRMILNDYRFHVPGCPPGWLGQYRERWDLLTGADEMDHG